jgi:hypothetical protein
MNKRIRELAAAIELLDLLVWRLLKIILAVLAAYAVIKAHL